MLNTTMRIGETLTFVYDFSSELVLQWQPDYQVSVGEFITIGPYVYECTDAGKTGPQQLETVPQTIGGTHNDGTVEWACRDFSTSGTDTLSSSSVTASSGLTVDSSAVTKSTYVTATVTATAKGKQHILVEVDTAAGETLQHKHYVFVE
jgi:hypothetical protein